MQYSHIRKVVSRIIPRSQALFPQHRHLDAVQEKGRKRNYSQFNLLLGEWRKQERLLNTEEITSFLEISTRAAACPMPFNLDVWDGLVCPFGCIYCFANAFRASLYTSFFDNSKTMGLRHCNPDFYKRELDKMQSLRGKDPHGLTGIRKAFAMEIPIRFGIRFEDFLRQERHAGVSLTLLRYLADTAYPVMINTKSDLVGYDEYVEALARNPAKAAVHVTLLTPDDDMNRKLEPGAPSYQKRLTAMKHLVRVGVRVVARIEPYLFLMNDDPDMLRQYIMDLWAIGVRNITFDTYSYSAVNPGIRQSFINQGYDFDRLFLAESDSQLLGSLLLGRYMDLFRAEGFSCSTFDLGNIPANDQDVCCEVGDWFEGHWNYGCIVMAARFIVRQEGQIVRWRDFRQWVEEHGGFLTPELEREVHELWNIEGNTAYSLNWVQGMVPAGWDSDGLMWTYVRGLDERERLLHNLTSWGWSNEDK